MHNKYQRNKWPLVEINIEIKRTHLFQHVTQIVPAGVRHLGIMDYFHFTAMAITTHKMVYLTA